MLNFILWFFAIIGFLTCCVLVLAVVGAWICSYYENEQYNESIYNKPDWE